MADYRCMKHDRVFEATTDQRRPGALATSTLPAHPAGGGHPDCPKCQEDAKGEGETVAGKVRVIARG
jgi:hypothetical protein